MLRQLPAFLLLLIRLLRDRRVSGIEKALFGLVIVYVLTPTDLLPDFLGVFGFVDDLYLVGLALGRLLLRSGPDVLLEHWDGDAEALGYLVEGVDQLGSILPRGVRRALRRVAEGKEV